MNLLTAKITLSTLIISLGSSVSHGYSSAGDDPSPSFSKCLPWASDAALNTEHSCADYINYNYNKILEKRTNRTNRLSYNSSENSTYSFSGTSTKNQAGL